MNLNNIDTAKFEITLEENDEQNGNLLDNVKVYASYKDNTVTGQDFSENETLFTTLDSSEFDISSGKPIVSQTIKVLEIADFLNLDPVIFEATDLFIFRYELVLTEGRVYSVSNAKINVSDATKPFYNSPFTYNAPLVCPLETSAFTGMYLIEQTSPYIYDPTLGDGTIIQLTAVDNTTRSFMTANYPFYCTSDNQFSFILVCG